jgi:hypothetical protein
VALATLASGCANFWPTASADATRVLAGTYSGWMSFSRLGNGVATMTVRDTGAFEGVLRLDDENRPFRGAITMLGARMLRYDGTFGDGAVALAGEPDRRTLKFMADGGGGTATFVLAK